MWRFRAAPVLLFHPLMRWPRVPVQNVRPSRFNPPFCPWPDCTAHRSRGRGFHRNGSYRTLSSPSRVPRFVCLDCNRSCSRQTFSTTYYLKRPELLIAIVFAGTRSSSTHGVTVSSPPWPKPSSTTTSRSSSVDKTTLWGWERPSGLRPGTSTTSIPPRTGGADAVPTGSKWVRQRGGGEVPTSLASGARYEA